MHPRLLFVCVIFGLLLIILLTGLLLVQFILIPASYWSKRRTWCRGVYPSSFWTSTLTPWDSRNRTMLSWPKWAATWSGVYPVLVSVSQSAPESTCSNQSINLHNQSVNTLIFTVNLDIWVYRRNGAPYNCEEVNCKALCCNII